MTSRRPNQAHQPLRLIHAAVLIALAVAVGLGVELVWTALVRAVAG